MAVQWRLLLASLLQPHWKTIIVRSLRLDHYPVIVCCSFKVILSTLGKKKIRRIRPVASTMANDEPPPTKSSSSSFSPTWQLPPSIEGHLEAFAIKSLIGGVAGGALFRSAAGMAFGIGCAAGSFAERAILAEPGTDVDPAIPKFQIPDVFSSWSSSSSTGGKKEGEGQS